MMRRLCHKVCVFAQHLNINNEDAHKAIAHEAAHKSDVIQYSNWWDKQICQGKEGIAQCTIRGLMIMLMVENLARLQTKSVLLKAYMEECGVFKPLDTTANPLGLYLVLSH